MQSGTGQAGFEKTELKAGRRSRSDRGHPNGPLLTPEKEGGASAAARYLGGSRDPGIVNHRYKENPFTRPLYIFPVANGPILA